MALADEKANFWLNEDTARPTTPASLKNASSEVKEMITGNATVSGLHLQSAMGTEVSGVATVGPYSKMSAAHPVVFAFALAAEVDGLTLN